MGKERNVYTVLLGKIKQYSWAIDMEITDNKKNC